jgi:hypothetical protein
MRYFLHWPCRSTSFTSPDLRSATLEIDKGSSNGEAANHHAERSVARDGRHGKWDRLVQEDRGASNGAGSNAIPRAGSGRPRVPGISVSVIASVGAKIRRSIRSAAEGVERMGLDGSNEAFSLLGRVSYQSVGLLAGRRGVRVGGARQGKRNRVKKKGEIGKRELEEKAAGDERGFIPSNHRAGRLEDPRLCQTRRAVKRTRGR